MSCWAIPSPRRKERLSDRDHDAWSGMCPSGLHGLDYRGQVCDLCPASFAVWQQDGSDTAVRVVQAPSARRAAEQCAREDYQDPSWLSPTTYRVRDGVTGGSMARPRFHALQEPVRRHHRRARRRGDHGHVRHRRRGRCQVRAAAKGGELMAFEQRAGRCTRCGRCACRASSLGARTASLGYPENTRTEVTASQNECDAYASALRERS